MATFRVYLESAQSTTVYVEAESAEEAGDAAERRARDEHGGPWRAVYMDVQQEA